MLKKWRAVIKFLNRIGDLPVHILAFRLFPALFIVSSVSTAIVMYTIFFVQSLGRWAGDSMDKIQALISLHL